MRSLTALFACAALSVFLISPALAESVQREFSLSGVSCHEGSRAVQMAVAAVHGVENVRVLVQAGKMFVTYDPAQTNPDTIAEAVREAEPAGSSSEYDAKPVEP